VITGDTMIVFGGKNASNVALNDLWWVNLAVTPNDSLEWHQETVTNPPPARYGHTAVLAGEKWAEPKMLVYGGHNGSSFVGDTVWALTIPKTGGASQFSWTRLYASGSPGPLEGHSAIAHPLGNNYRMIVFGGYKDSLRHNAFKFDLLEDGTRSWSFQHTDGTAPPKRMRHAAEWDKEWHRMVVFGGDESTSSGGASNGLWGLPLEYDAGTNPRWTTLTPDTTMPAARWGHTLTFDIRGYDARFAELYDPKTPENIGVWEKHDVQPKWLPPYPFMFNLKDGNLFFAGNGPEHVEKTDSYQYSVSTESWSDQDSSGFLGGSAVYWPDLDKVMKCGGDDDVTFQDEKKSGSAAISGGTTTWTMHDSLPESRTYHNLTQLPDGRALLTGGRNRSGAGSAFTKIPRFWDPATNSWGADLASDLGNRGYHSGALLLPDARVLCAGGPGVGSGDWRASIFSPPYLYKDGTTLADRPSISSLPAEIHYGEPFYLVVDNAVTKNLVSLIRAGAPTHGFDQNQRFVKQNFTKYPSDQWLRSVLTTNENHVPPGDYLLFVVDSTATGKHPSIGKWVRIGSENDVTAPAAAGLTYTDLTSNSVVLKWTAPGDDGTAGTATEYDLRFRTGTPITTANFNSCTTLVTNVPRRVGSQEQYAKGSLPSCVFTFFGLKTKDEKGNWSALSVVPVGTLGCSGGGGPGELPPESARQVGGAAVVAREQWLRLGSSNGGVAGLTLSHAGAAVRVDSAMIVCVPRAGSTMTLTASGWPEVVERQPPSEVRSGGTTIVPTLAGYEAQAGERLIVQFDSAEEVRGVVVETGAADSGNTPERWGIRVLVPDPEGGWTTTAQAVPNSMSDELVVPGVTADSVCLEFTGGYELRLIERLVATSASPTIEVIQPALWHSRLGQVVSVDELELKADETLDLRAALPEREEAADVLLYLKTSEDVGQGLRAELTTGPRPPTEFALGQNEPNPFGGGTRIRFALPARSQVELEVFDIRGRRVRTLTKTVWPAGHHTLDWNGRDAQGRRVGPGVYLYRMQAGPYRASRKLAVLPQ
jgi:Domain of unknown function (DUF1929)/FlgD Ig-like domain/Galactose oxidase, central domain